jgi:hypothetical protein
MVDFGSEAYDTNPIVRKQVRETILSAQTRMVNSIENEIAHVV